MRSQFDFYSLDLQFSYIGKQSPASPHCVGRLPSRKWRFEMGMMFGGRLIGGTVVGGFAGGFLADH